jgi:hypothetical protein
MRDLIALNKPHSIGYPEPIRQYHGTAQCIRQLLLDDVDFAHVIRIEIEANRG